VGGEETQARQVADEHAIRMGGADLAEQAFLAGLDDPHGRQADRDARAAGERDGGGVLADVLELAVDRGGGNFCRAGLPGKNRAELVHRARQHVKPRRDGTKPRHCSAGPKSVLDLRALPVQGIRLGDLPRRGVLSQLQ
jgi:hypothetical protein